MTFLPAYLQLSLAELEGRAERAIARLAHCDLCPRACGVDRLADERGVCKTGRRARVSSYGPHFGEEAPLRGWNGSGTLFFARCNLHCQFCQNHTISQADSGPEVMPAELAAIMLDLQQAGCHNINLVSPSHVVAQILEALVLAVQGGLRLPLVYNTGGYDALTALEALDGVVDIYMPDMKYASSALARKYSLVRKYASVNRAAVKEMHRQVGDLQLDEHGLALRGLLVRLLVLPHNLAGTRQTVRFLAQEISPNTYLNLMNQYYPSFHAGRFPELNRCLTPGEYAAAVEMTAQAGLTRLDARS
ncbi:MAG: radical SAM protein [Anaerolineales bacterium]